ncbi:hypothetical protein [Flexivirga alba]|uniref:MbtH family protein n=1 Tax=Flexivirga alba TaxID=702742 RepID=A0ABW2ADV7_9MICO
MSGNPDAHQKASSTELYFVVEGRVGRLIIWSCTNRIPLDWRVAFGPGTHGQCERYLEAHQHLAHH